MVVNSIKCACGKSDCKGKVALSGGELWAENDAGKEVLVYLDAAARYELSVALQESIINEVSSPKAADSVSDATKSDSGSVKPKV